jgi:hypothetical protein
MADALETTAALLDRRWRRAVDLLLRETIRYRRAGLAEWERLRVARRRRSLQRIVRKALSDYHRIQVERRDSGPSGR